MLHFIDVVSVKWSRAAVCKSTCPHRREPKPKNVHHSHWSTDRATQLKGFPPNCTITTWRNRKNNILGEHLHTHSLSSLSYDFLFFLNLFPYLNNEGSQNDTTEDEVVKDAVKDVPFAVDLAGVDLVEKLHHHKSVEDDGVVFGGRGVEGSVPAAVDVKHFLSCTNNNTGLTIDINYEINYVGKVFANVKVMHKG